MCPLLTYYAVYSGNSLPTFRNYLFISSSRDCWSLKMGPPCCPETPRNYHYILCNVSEDRRHHIHCGGSTKWRTVNTFPLQKRSCECGTVLLLIFLCLKSSGMMAFCGIFISSGVFFVCSDVSEDHSASIFRDTELAERYSKERWWDNTWKKITIGIKVKHF